MDGLIPSYINHTVQLNDPTNITMWTESTILTAIGDTVRYSIPTSPIISAKWMYQQYKIINLLRWITVSGSVAGVGDSEAREGTGTTINDAIDDYNNNSWYSTTDGGLYTVRDYASVFSTTIRHNRGYPTLITNRATDIVRADTDLYVKAEASTGYTYSSPDGYIEGEYYNIGHVTNHGSGIVKADDIKQHSLITTAPVYSSASCVFNSAHSIAVSKFDIPTGFKYKDWQ
jgi:hypothetical protein